MFNQPLHKHFASCVYMKYAYKNKEIRKSNQKSTRRKPLKNYKK